MYPLGLCSNPPIITSTSPYQTIYPITHWNDIIGMRDAKQAMQEILYLPMLIDKKLFTGIRSLPSTLLLYGPPGTGKTMLVHAMASESKRKLYTIAPSTILSKWAGESEKTLKRIFEEAAGNFQSSSDELELQSNDQNDILEYNNSNTISSNKKDTNLSSYSVPNNNHSITTAHKRSRNYPSGSENNFAPTYDITSSITQNNYNSEYTPSLSTTTTSSIPPSSSVPNNGIIFIDEIDALVIRRDSESSNTDNSTSASIDVTARRLLNELLLLLSNIPTHYPNILVIAATNRIQDCDQAILRRFHRRIYCSLPHFHDRYQLITKVLHGIHTNIRDEEYAKIAENTEGWNNSDLRALCTETAMIPIREIIQSHQFDNENTKYTYDNPVSHPPINSNQLITSLRPLECHDFFEALKCIRPSSMDANNIFASIRSTGPQNTLLNNSNHPIRMNREYSSQDHQTDTICCEHRSIGQNTDTTNDSLLSCDTLPKCPIVSMSTSPTNFVQENIASHSNTVRITVPPPTTSAHISIPPTYTIVPTLPPGMQYVAMRSEVVSTLLSNQAIRNHDIIDSSSMNDSINAFLHRFGDDNDIVEDNYEENKDRYPTHT